MSTAAGPKILVIGASGTIGQAVVAALKTAIPTATILSGGRNGADVKIDISDTESIRTALAPFVAGTDNKLDHIICLGGDALFKPVSALTKADLSAAFQSKALGQVDLVLQGQYALKAAGGSITLTTGILDKLVIPFSVPTGLINNTVNAFVRQAPGELPPGVRLNCVSPGLVTESVGKYGAYFQGFGSVPAAQVALAYVRSVQSTITGKVLEIAPAVTFQES